MKDYIYVKFVSVGNKNSKQYINGEWNEQLSLCDACLSARNSSKEEYINRKWTVKWRIIFRQCFCLWGTTTTINTLTENETNNYLNVMLVCLQGTVAKNNTSTANEEWNEGLYLCQVCVCGEQKQQTIHQQRMKWTIIFMWCLSVCEEQ
jgi:Cys-tRNA synthase (O-phospho-L-seryl-tRNA:Cys-tRNA synthase)